MWDGGERNVAIQGYAMLHSTTTSRDYAALRVAFVERGHGMDGQKNLRNLRLIVTPEAKVFYAFGFPSGFLAEIAALTRNLQRRHDDRLN
jgi:hypothetical protein